MAHRVEYNEAGTRARIILDLDGASLDADANPIGAEWVTLQNVLTNVPGVLPKRGAITNAGANTTDINDVSGSLAFLDAQRNSGNTYRPYVGACVDGANVEVYVQPEATSRVSIHSGINGPVPTSKCPTADDVLIVCGRRGANTTYPNHPTRATLFAGSSYTAAASYSTGTVTVTVGSNEVTGSGTAWTAAMEGMFFNSGTGFYVVRKVASATSLFIDRNYADTINAGSGKGYNLSVHGLLMSGGGGNPLAFADDYASFKVAASCWGRLAVASLLESAVDSTAPPNGGTPAPTSPWFRSRVRWSGAVGSDDGNSATFTGIYGFDAGGFVDLAAKYGEILALVPARDSVLAFQESGLTVIHGAPVYDGAGSIDISETHPGVAINGGFAFESTPEGVFFFDKNVGPCVYDGQRVQRLGDKRVTRTMLPYGITAVGYYDGKVLFSGTTTAGIFVFDTATGQWSLQVPPAIVSCLIAGRVENDEDVVGLGAGLQVVNLTNMFDAPGVAATDWDGTAFTVDIKTGKIGDTLSHLRPERLWVTYRLTDLTTTNPYLTATVSTGLPDTSATNYTHSNGATELVETTDVETRVLELNLQADPMTQLRLLQSNAAGKLELYALVLDCTVEAEGASS